MYTIVVCIHLFSIQWYTYLNEYQKYWTIFSVSLPFSAIQFCCGFYCRVEFKLWKTTWICVHVRLCVMKSSKIVFLWFHSNRNNFISNQLDRFKVHLTHLKNSFRVYSRCAYLSLLTLTPTHTYAWFFIRSQFDISLIDFMSYERISINIGSYIQFI